MTPEQRRSAGNGIWLCQKCAKLVDSDPRYTKPILLYWKGQAQERARRALDNHAIANSGPEFASTLVLAARQLQNAPLDTTKVGPSGWGMARIGFRPICAPRDLTDIDVPIAFRDDVPPDACLITMTCQNLGTGLDYNVKIDISFAACPAIRAVEIRHPQRLQLIDGGNTGSSFASFTIPALLPRETQVASIIADSRPQFDIRLWSQRSGHSPEVFVYDVMFGPTELLSKAPSFRSPGDSP